MGTEAATYLFAAQRLQIPQRTNTYSLYLLMAKTFRADSKQKHKDKRPEVTSEILDRTPPQSIDAERALLGSLLLNSMMCDDVAMVLSADDFYSDAHKTLYQHIMAMHDAGKKVDVMLLVDRLSMAGDLDAVGGQAYLAELAMVVPFASNAVHYANIIREKATLRELIIAGTEILADAYDSTLEPTELVSQCEQRIFAVHDKRSQDQFHASNDIMIDVLSAIDKRMQNQGAGGVPTGYRDLDEMTGGMHGSEFIVLAARPSMGKTAIALNIIENVILKARQPALFVSLEMSQLELAMRLVSSRGKINASNLRTGILSKAEHATICEVAGDLSEAPLFVDDTPNRSVTQIAALARRLKRKDQLSVIAIDYLQLLQPDDPRDPRQEQVAKMARRLKGLARELEVPILCLAQLNRQTESGKGQESHRPKLSQLRESGAIEQDADLVMFIHREEYYCSPNEIEEKNLRGKAQIIIAKQRNGPVGDVDLLWRPQFTRFESVSNKREHSDFGSNDAPEPTDFG